eukprot:CAMPEP_0117483872 /NCGR_PEP_ID=MMETSP0784-20121206/14167_1 /TAXON_ID=39447 /ORGANISM="" /LENGTH=110 /DNA_ID=CAMNT_0005278429 /DNA_START=489 /DNA_END=821 /DNA_ORIENTATION=-
MSQSSGSGTTQGIAKNVTQLKAVENAGKYHMEIGPTRRVQMNAAAKQKPDIGATNRPDWSARSELSNKNAGLDMKTAPPTVNTRDTMCTKPSCSLKTTRPKSAAATTLML